MRPRDNVSRAKRRRQTIEPPIPISKPSQPRVRSRIVVEDLTAITAPFTREDTFEVALDKDPRHRIEALA
jgi:hypothetical protein